MDNSPWLKLEEADWFFRKMVRRFVKERDKITAEGVTLPGLMVLHKLEQSGEQRLGELAEELDLTSGAITALCDKLEELEFAVRRRPKEDRRAVVLDITEQGRAMLRRNREVGIRCIQLLFDCFTEEELDAQIRYYKRITENLVDFAERVLQEPEGSPEQAQRDRQREPEPDAATPGSRYITY